MAQIEMPKWATTVTPLSKYLAMVLFILLPFIGFYLGYQAGLNHSSASLPLAKAVVSPTTTPQQYQVQLVPTAIPEPINTYTWKTYADWKYHYSVTLPPEFASYIPGEGYTGNTIDPHGTGFVQFEDTTISGDYPYRIAKYGFYIRIEPGTPAGSKCVTDQECLNLIKTNVGRATAIPLHARILNRDIEGLATVHASPNSSSPTGEDLSVYYEYPFIANGQVFHAEVSFYYLKSLQDAQTKDPYINAILASISFANQ